MENDDNHKKLNTDKKSIENCEFFYKIQKKSQKKLISTKNLILWISIKGLYLKLKTFN